MEHLERAGRFTAPEAGRGNHWVEHLRVPAVSVGTYSVPAGAEDTQRPHTEDEVYVVTAGTATFVAGERRVPVRAGTVLFVPAAEAHRFVDVTEDLAVLVVFAPAEYTNAPR
ncbi:MAG TPA: cupin domain-containing protein [Pseudonocardiaceae bacterium]